jgi:putative copper resistance protein D
VDTAQVLSNAALTGVDPLLLVVLVGALACRLWVVPSSGPTGRTCPAAVDRGLWRLQGMAMTGLSLNSLALLWSRAAEMGGRPWTAAGPLLWPLLAQTHYGQAWLIRVLALMGAWLAWLTARHRPGLGTPPALMLLAGAVVVWTRSATGHNAAWGDWTPEEWADWLHGMSAGLWGGGLVAFSLVIGPQLIQSAGEPTAQALGMVERLSSLSALALGGVLLSGLYVAWRQHAEMLGEEEASVGGVPERRDTRHLTNPEHGCSALAGPQG